MQNQPHNIDDAWNGNAYNPEITNRVVYGYNGYIRRFQKNYNFDDTVLEA